MADTQQFFESMGQFFATVGDFIVDLFEDIAFIVDLVGRVVKDIPLYFQALPAAATSLIITIFSIAVIYLIVGRN